MIEKVHLHWFKRFQDQNFTLKDAVVLAGPNNAGKTSLIQAIAAWHFAFAKWAEARGMSRGKLRTGVPITRQEFLTIPVRALNLLWHDTSTALRKHEGTQGAPRVMSIALSGKDDNRHPWKLTMEFRYANPETLYAKPAVASPQIVTELITHIPSFSGIATEEPIHAREYQDWLIGQGKPGDIARNLLAEVYQSPGQWEKLCKEIQDLFGYSLLPPQYIGRPFILCEYLPKSPSGRGHGGQPKLDIANSGSGFLQTLMLFAFFYARPSSILLLDEPDAHLHVALQKQIYDRLRTVAKARNCQLIIATHSEVLIDSTDTEKIISFYETPHALQPTSANGGARKSLKLLLSTDITCTESKTILYVEGESDFSILRAWAQVLEHSVKNWFDRWPYYRLLQHGHKEGKNHFGALLVIRPEMKGFMLLDSDGDQKVQPSKNCLVVHKWPRYEIESYLVHPDVIERFINLRWTTIASSVREKMQNELPPVVMNNPLGNQSYWKRIAASKELIPVFLADTNVTKSEYYQIAEQMKPDEVHDDVKKMLDEMATHFGIS